MAASIFVDYAFESAVEGVTTDGAVVYNYNKMIEYLIEKEGWSVHEAIEWIDTNCIRTIPYMEDVKPIIYYPTEDYDSVINHIQD